MKPSLPNAFRAFPPGRLSLLLLAVTACPLLGSAATWTNLLGGSWSNAANWQDGVIATNVDGIADFSTLDITANRTVTNAGVWTIGNLVFGDAVQDFNWTLTGGTNLLAVSAGSPSIVVNSGQNTTISTSLGGTQGFTKTGGGTLTLNGVNRLTGGIQVYGGALALNSAGALSPTVNPAANPLTVSNATLSSGAFTFTNNVLFQGNDSLVAPTGNSLNLVGSLSGSGVVTMSGTGVLAQRGDMSGFSGTLVVNSSGKGGIFMGQNDDSTTGSGSGYSGSSNAVFVINDGSRNYLYNGAMPATNFMGELRGGSAALVFAKYGSRAGDTLLEVGHLGTSSKFGGSIRNCDTPAGNPVTLGVRKVGAGSLELAGTSTYTGPTEVRSGRLTVSGSLGATPVSVSAGGTLELSGAVSSPTITVQSGGTFLVDGSANLGSAAVAVNGLMDVSAFANNFYLNSASLNGSGVVTGGVIQVASTINPGPVGGAGTLTITNGDLTVYGGTLAFDLANDPTNGLNDLLVVNGNFNLAGYTTLSINQLTGTLGGGTYPLIKFTGSLSGDLSLLALTGVSPLDTLVLNPNGQEIDLLVNPAPSVVWTGDGAANLWDIATSTNWLLNTSASTFTNGYAVTFNNLGATNPLVSIPATVTPAVVAVSGSSNYIFAGPADISGGCSLLKSGAGQLTLQNANTFLGQTVISGGILQLGDGVTTDGSVAGNIVDNAALVFANPLDQTYAGSLSGSGSLTKRGAGTLTLTGSSTLTGPTLISAGALCLGNGYSAPGALGTGAITNYGLLAINQPAAFTMTNPITTTGGIDNLAAGPVTFAGTLAGSGPLTNDLAAGRLYLVGTNTYSGGTFVYGGVVEVLNAASVGTGPVLINDFGGGALHLYTTAGSTNVLANNITLPNATTSQFEMDNRPTVQTTVRFTGLIAGGAPGQPTPLVSVASSQSGQEKNNRCTIVLDNPANTFTTIPQVLNGTLAFTSDGALGNATNGIVCKNLNSVNGGAAPDITIQGLRFDADNITLNASRTIELVNAYEFVNVQSFNGTIAGPVVGSGTLRKLGTGTLRLNGPGSLAGQTVINAGTLVLNNTWSGSSVTANSGATLAGTGIISAPVTIGSGATLAPGPALAPLTLQSNLTLAADSTTLMQLNATTGAASQVAGVNTLTFGGTLSVVNLGGTLTNGQSFQLFTAAAYSGDFASLNLPVLPAGLSWRWNPGTGTLSVGAGVSTLPTPIAASVAGGNLNLSWPDDHLGWRLEVQTNSFGAGLGTNWQTWSGSSTTNSVAVPIDPAAGSVFLRLVYP